MRLNGRPSENLGGRGDFRWPARVFFFFFFVAFLAHGKGGRVTQASEKLGGQIFRCHVRLKF